MRVWLYYRLSHDEDTELNSLTNQRKILVEYANINKHAIIGESFDDNVSGMHFNRDGIDRIYDQVEQRTIDAVVVKDLSRLGRHRTKTDLFIDYLRENGIRVLSVTENIDSMNEDDDLLIGFKGIMNDMYAKDISKKIRAGYRQKQRDGIILSLPLGYYKDKNTNAVCIVEGEAEIVRRIFSLYLEGYGLKGIAHMLNSEGIKSPLYYHNNRDKEKVSCNSNKTKNKYLWENTTVKRILQNECYKGTLVCHKSFTSKIYHIRKTLPANEHFVHEDIVPAIISKEKWEQVQFILKSKTQKKVRAGEGKPCHRYAGLLKCAECGCSFICKIRKRKGKPDRMEYNCSGYHRYGINYCTSHRINEDTLDKLVFDELVSLKERVTNEYESIEDEARRWMKQKSNVNKKLYELQMKLEQRQADQQDILLERIRDKDHAEVYTKMLMICEEDIERIKKQINAITDYNVTIKKCKEEMKESLDIIERIVSEGKISNTNLRFLVDSIIISQKDNNLNITIILNAKFERYRDCIDEERNLTGRVFIT